MAEEPSSYELDARLHVVANENGQTREFPIGLPTSEGGQLIVGRSRRADLTIHDDHISNRHLRVYFEDGRHWIEDLGSTHGTDVAGERISKPTPLTSGDTIALGRSVCEYRCVERAVSRPISEPPPTVTEAEADGSAATMASKASATVPPDSTGASGAPSAASPNNQRLAKQDDRRQAEPIRPGILTRMLGVLLILGILALIGYLGWQLLFGSDT